MVKEMRTGLQAQIVQEKNSTPIRPLYANCPLTNKLKTKVVSRTCSNRAATVGKKKDGRVRQIHNDRSPNLGYALTGHLTNDLSYQSSNYVI